MYTQSHLVSNMADSNSIVQLIKMLNDKVDDLKNRVSLLELEKRPESHVGHEYVTSAQPGVPDEGGDNIIERRRAAHEKHGNGSTTMPQRDEKEEKCETLHKSDAFPNATIVSGSHSWCGSCSSDSKTDVLIDTQSVEGS